MSGLHLRRKASACAQTLMRSSAFGAGLPRQFPLLHSKQDGCVLSVPYSAFGTGLPLLAGHRTQGPRCCWAWTCWRRGGWCWALPAAAAAAGSSTSPRRPDDQVVLLGMRYWAFCPYSAAIHRILVEHRTGTRSSAWAWFQGCIAQVWPPCSLVPAKQDRLRRIHLSVMPSGHARLHTPPGLMGRCQGASDILGRQQTRGCQPILAYTRHPGAGRQTGGRAQPECALCRPGPKRPGCRLDG
jgi:hypothetical protein